MNFTDLSKHLVTDVCPLGEGFPVTVDANKFTGECYRRLARTYKARAEQFDAEAPQAEGEAGSVREAAERYERTMELSAITADVEREQFADVLACDRYGVIESWVLEDGTLPTFENLMMLDGPKLRFLFEWAREISGPKERGTPMRTQPSLTTSETTSDGSSDPTTLSPESPTTLTTTSSRAS